MKGPFQAEGDGQAHQALGARDSRLNLASVLHDDQRQINAVVGKKTSRIGSSGWTSGCFNFRLTDLKWGARLAYSSSGRRSADDCRFVRTSVHDRSGSACSRHLVESLGLLDVIRPFIDSKNRSVVSSSGQTPDSASANNYSSFIEPVRSLPGVSLEGV